MSELKVDKITPRLGTTLTLGDSGDTINFGSGVLPNFENLTVTGDLTVDTNSLKVDSTNNFVGIGTATPSSALDIVGNIVVSGTVDGRDIATDGTKLDTIATNATANPNAIDNVVEDTTPQLGGNLDLNSNNITGTGNINITGTVAATSYTGDGSSLTGINTDLVSDTTPQLGGNLDSNGNAINMADNNQINFGNSTDGRIVHNGTDFIIQDLGTGDLKLVGDQVRITDGSGAENKAVFTSNGSADLYHDNSKKLETTINGITVNGYVLAQGSTVGFAGDDNVKVQLGNSGDFQIYHDGSNSYINEQGTGNLLIRASSAIRLQRHDGTENFLTANQDGSVELYYNGAKKFETQNNGVTLSSGRMFASGGETISVGFWAKWKGTGTVTLEDDYNVSSIGDVANGQYDVNFTINCNNTNYAVAGTSTALNHSGWNVKSSGIGNAPTNLSTGSVRITTENTDSYYVSCIGFGDW